MLEEDKGDPAIATIGDGLVELVAPREHSLLWDVGGKPSRTARFFAENPRYMRLLEAAQAPCSP